MNPKVDAFLDQAEKWQAEMRALRKIVLACQLTEELKWGKPCYTFQNTNLLMLYALKESCALGFFNGALLKDPLGILIKPGENTQAGRWIKFTSLQEIQDREPSLKAYIAEAMAAEKAGLKVPLKKPGELVFPTELQQKLASHPALKAAFLALTPGRQRAYNLFFCATKQAKTRAARIEQCLPKILQGKGIHDCVCGHSKRLPQCDGSHKQLQ